MSIKTVFTKSFLETKKEKRLKLIFLLLKKIILNNWKMFLQSTFAAIIVAFFNFNVVVIIRDAFTPRPSKTCFNEIVDEIKGLPGNEEAGISHIKKIIKEKIEGEKEKSNEKIENILKKLGLDKGIENKKLKSEEIDNLIQKINEVNQSKENIFSYNKYEFNVNFLGYKPFKGKEFGINSFVFHVLFFLVFFKFLSSVYHYYCMHYAYDAVEKDLKKDLFYHFVKADYASASKIAPNLITQFASDLDIIVDHIWYIPNRLIYLTTSIILYVCDSLKYNGEKTNWKLTFLASLLFIFLAIIEWVSFTPISKLSVEIKKRLEGDNKTIYERIRNLEYIKCVGGEEFEKQKINQQLDATFYKNKNSLLKLALLKAAPNYLLIPSNPILFVLLIITTVTDEVEKSQAIFNFANFIRYYSVIQRLNSDVSRIIDSLLTLEELSSSLVMIKESIDILNQNHAQWSGSKNHQWENGDIKFDKAVFAYPQKPQQLILRELSFSFKKGKSYGIAGKNGIGKSTINKNILRLYNLQRGKILIGGHSIEDTEKNALRDNICYQTNRPGLFSLSVAENVFYPRQFKEENAEKLMAAAEKVGIWEFIKNLPDKFKTVLEEGGSNLSEGQKQQIAAMKIFIRDYDIYIFDEILSNVHPVLKKQIIKNIFEKVRGKTIIVIDHHREIFQYVDYIYQFTGEKLIEIKETELFLGE